MADRIELDDTTPGVILSEETATVQLSDESESIVLNDREQVILEDTTEQIVLRTSQTVDWGNIQGTLGNQADLQAALDGKSDSGHAHDDRYYTESEADAFLGAKSASSHDHHGWYPRHDAAQSLSTAARAQARSNIDAAASAHSHGHAELSEIDLTDIELHDILAWDGSKLVAQAQRGVDGGNFADVFVAAPTALDGGSFV